MAKSTGLVDESEVLGYFESLSNWGRWGETDQLGTLNFITDENRRVAASLVQTGRAVSCGRLLTPKHQHPGDEPILHHMITSGEGAPDKGFGAASDWIGMSFHGYSITHIDAVSHLFWNGKMYNDRPASDVKTGTGARVGGIDQARDGIVSRGILLDIPRYRGDRWLEPGEGIGPDEILACAESEGLDLRSGDILLVRVGREPRTAEVGPTEPVMGGSPGLHASALPLLHDSEIALLGADATNDVMPSGYPRVEVPIHSVGIVAMGLWLLDNAELEELASACARENRWEFMMAIAPLRLKNTTGSPVNPIAIL